MGEQPGIADDGAPIEEVDTPARVTEEWATGATGAEAGEPDEESAQQDATPVEETEKISEDQGEVDQQKEQGVDAETLGEAAESPTISTGKRKREEVDGAP